MHRRAAWVDCGVVLAVDRSGSVHSHAKVNRGFFGFDNEADAVWGGEGAIVEVEAVVVGVAGFG